MPEEKGNKPEENPKENTTPPEETKGDSPTPEETQQTDQKGHEGKTQEPPEKTEGKDPLGDLERKFKGRRRLLRASHRLTEGLLAQQYRAEREVITSKTAAEAGAAEQATKGQPPECTPKDHEVTCPHKEGEWKAAVASGSTHLGLVEWCSLTYGPQPDATEPTDDQPGDAWTNPKNQPLKERIRLALRRMRNHGTYLSEPQVDQITRVIYVLLNPRASLIVKKWPTPVNSPALEPRYDIKDTLKGIVTGHINDYLIKELTPHQAELVEQHAVEQLALRIYWSLYDAQVTEADEQIQTHHRRAQSWEDHYYTLHKQANPHELLKQVETVVPEALETIKNTKPWKELLKRYRPSDPMRDLIEQEDAKAMAKIQELAQKAQQNDQITAEAIKKENDAEIHKVLDEAIPREEPRQRSEPQDKDRQAEVTEAIQNAQLLLGQTTHIDEETAEALGIPPTGNP